MASNRNQVVLGIVIAIVFFYFGSSFSSSGGDYEGGKPTPPRQLQQQHVSEASVEDKVAKALSSGKLDDPLQRLVQREVAKQVAKVLREAPSVQRAVDGKTQDHAPERHDPPPPPPPPPPPVQERRDPASPPAPSRARSNSVDNGSGSGGLPQDEVKRLQSGIAGTTSDSQQLQPIVPIPSRQEAEHAAGLTAERSATREHCKQLSSMRNTLVSLPSDISELLPYLEGYADEVRVAAEAGSRLGTSTTVLLNRYNRAFASLEIDVKREMRRVHTYQNSCIDGKNVDVMKSMIVEGDDIKMGLPFKEVEFMFLDTLHNADQLHKELEVFPSKITKWMAFHDSFSFKDRDEEVNIRRKDVPAEVSAWRGLKVAIANFLRRNDDWVEEMSFTHNNGLLILRRRSFQLTVQQPDTTRQKWIVEQSAKAGIRSAEDVSAFMIQNSAVTYREQECMNGYVAFGDQTRPNPSLCGMGWGTHFPQRCVRIIANMIREADRIPLFNKLTFQMGYTIASSSAAFVLNPAKQSETLKALETIALGAAATGSVRQSHAFNVVCTKAEKCQLAGSAYDAFRTSFRDDLSLIRTHSEIPVTPVEVVVLSAATLASFSETETFGSIGRIAVHGTAFADATHYNPKGFELMTVLNEGVGIAVWQKKNTQLNHYVVM